MKLLRYGPAGEERPGLLDDHGRIRDLSGHVPDLCGEVLAPDRLRQLAALDWRSLPLVEGAPRLGPPVTGIGKMLGIGLNYRNHAEETGVTPAPSPWSSPRRSPRSAGRTIRS